MPAQFRLPGIKRLSLKEHLDNTNMLEGPGGATYEPTTLNSLRSKSSFREDIGAFRPSMTRSSMLTKSASPDFKPKVFDEMTPMKEIAPVKDVDMSGLIAAKEIPSTPMADLSIKGPGKTETETSQLLDFWKSKMGGPEAKGKLGKLSLDQFVTMAGSLAHAFAPDTPQGRAGAALARIARPVYEKRLEREMGAPERELARRLTEAKIADLEKADTPKTAMGWFIRANPEATAKQVSDFKKSLDTETKGSYWRTTDDQGKVSIYKGGELIFGPGKGKTKAETLYKTEEGFLPASEAKGKPPYEKEAKPSPVTWTTATKSLGLRFGKQDPMGNIIVTKELQKQHSIAQKKLVELQEEGLEPLDAINKSEQYARHLEERYWQYHKEAIKNKKLSRKERKTYIKRLKDAYKSKYGYVPRVKR